jgi:hypothetical protein
MCASGRDDNRRSSAKGHWRLMERRTSAKLKGDVCVRLRELLNSRNRFSIL